MHRHLVAAAAAFAAMLCTAPGNALAHHGWAWTTGKNVEMAGLITKVKLGNPHGILEAKVGEVTWVFEVGQPWRNERAGLKDGDLAEGVEIRVVGEPAADPKNKRLKVETLYLGTREFQLYPERD